MYTDTHEELASQSCAWCDQCLLRERCMHSMGCILLGYLVIDLGVEHSSAC